MSHVQADFLLDNVGQLVTMGGRGEGPRRSSRLRDLGIVPQASVAALKGTIVAVGPSSQVRHHVQLLPDARVLDAEGRMVAPGFVDSHTHLVFGGWRHEEYALRSQGASYLEIAAAGGGIASTVASTRAAPPDELYERSMGFLDTMLLQGTTTCEVKSGYGLDLDNEIKQLEVARRCDADHPISIVSTFLGAHAFPPEYSGDRAGYVELVISMLPVIKERELARFVDVFCDAGAFTVDEARKILTAAKDLGFGLKLHADELESTGATQLGCDMGASSCDHLIVVSDEGIAKLAQTDTVGVVLPATSCFLGKIPGAPARAMVDAGAAIALATDFNPGTCTATSMPLCMTLACSLLGLSPEEAFQAVTYNGAWAIGLGGKVGALAVGLPLDAVLFDADDYREVPYRFGANLVHTVVKEGKVVVEGGRICKESSGW